MSEGSSEKMVETGGLYLIIGRGGHFLISSARDQPVKWSRLAMRSFWWSFTGVAVNRYDEIWRIKEKERKRE